MASSRFSSAQDSGFEVFDLPPAFSYFIDNNETDIFVSSTDFHLNYKANVLIAEEICEPLIGIIEETTKKR